MQLLESLREMHPDKLTGVLEQHILDGESNSVRQALPSLIHQHPELRAPLQEIAERLKQSSPAYTADNHSADDASLTGTDNNNRHNANDAAIETISGHTQKCLPVATAAVQSVNSIRTATMSFATTAAATLSILQLMDLPAGESCLMHVLDLRLARCSTITIVTGRLSVCNAIAAT